MRMRRGSKYEVGRDIKTIAKLIREDIQAAIKAKTLPARLKTRVRIERFSGGGAVDIVVTDGMDGCFNPEFWRYMRASYSRTPCPPRYTETGEALLAALERIAKAYQREEVDTGLDYHSTNFYLEVTFDRRVEAASV